MSISPILHSVLVATLAIAGAGCGDDDDGGPIDGTWSLTATRCDAQPAQSPPFTLEVADTVGTFTLTFAADCVLAYEERYSYDDGTITITPEAASCPQSAGCAAIGVSCTALPPPVAFDFVLAGDTLEFSKISAGPPGEPCPAGEAVTFTMSR